MVFKLRFESFIILNFDLRIYGIFLVEIFKLVNLFYKWENHIILGIVLIHLKHQIYLDFF